jgi:diguanylate cyclase (GGDEF)-like protein
VTIRLRLLLLVLGTALLPAILVGGRYFQDRGKDIETTIRGLAATARTIASNFDAKIQATTQLHFGLSRARDLVAPDKAECSNFLAEVLEKNPQFTGILTIDPEGRLLCDSLRTGRVLDLRDRGYFKQSLSTTNSTVIEPVFGRLTGSAVLQIAHPARDEARRLQFILLASLDLNKLMTEQIRNLPQGQQVLLVDGKGVVLTSSLPQPRAGKPGESIANSDLFRFAAKNTDGTRELVGIEGETQVWAVADTLAIGGVSLHVLVGRSKAELAAGPNRRLSEDMAILGVLSLLLFAGAWLLAEFAIRFQISRIVTMAERLGAGDLGARIMPPYPKGELGGLMTVLNGTAASLQRQKQDIEDLNLRLSQSQRLEALERHRLDVAINNIPQGLLLYDATNRLVVCNQRYIELYGVSPEVAKPGCSFHDLMMHRKAIGSFKGDVGEFCSRILGNMALGRATSSILEANGRSVQVVHQPLQAGGWIATMEDITERKRSETRIFHMAHFDALTDLPNRVLFREQLDHGLRSIEAGKQLAVLYIDIDEFKRINDSLGHSIGDELLKAVAGRLCGCLASTDFVARLGGDEFAVIQTGVERPSDTMDLIGRIYQALREPYECVGHLLTTDASIGIALSPQDGTDLDQLLKNADLAMYEAKADGRRTYRFFEPGMEARVNALRTLELDLRQAITDGGLEIYYQPLVNLTDDRVAGCEALLRWNHSERGMISPAEFIPVAEETGLIDALGEWVLNAACAEAATWPDRITVAVNVSPVQFRSQAFALKVALALAASGLPPHRLELEITEAVLIRDDEAALAMLHQLRKLGVRIALDDFGTGYSSLSYLQRFPFDKIKIDRSFIKEIAEQDGSASIVQAVVNIAAARHITTTAEGVETERQRDILRQLGCTEMQGYLFSPAISAADIRRLLQLRPDPVVGAA